MKLLKFIIAALGVTLASAAFADPPSVVGRLNYLSGPVSFAPAQAEEDWVAASLNRPITTGDRLWTDSNAFAEMHVGSLAVRMAPQTSMDVLNLDDRALQLRVAEGDVNLRVRRLSSDRLIEIATPSGAVVVRQPGSYRISVDGDSSTVTVRVGGQAEVFTAGSSILVRDAEEVAISRARPELFAAAQLDEFDRWCADRDRRHDRVASTRYVPAEMTGYEDLDQYGEWRTVAQYGNVWIPTSVPTDWAPYRYGHWVWIAPWGWTWVDDQPWGFAPSHYGRWVWYDHYWAWAPGRLVERPVYSPALVAFIGGANFSVSVGPAVGWVPLGYREPFIPWYSASPTYVRNVNVAHNVTNLNATNIRYVNRMAPTGVTVVSRDNFIAARPVQQATINVPSRTLATAPVTRGAPVTQPQRTSFARQERGSRPPAQILSREAVVVNRPPALAQQAARVAPSAERLPVRVIERRERANLQVNQAPRADARAARPAIQPPRADAPVAPQRQPQAVQEQRPRDQQTRQQEQAREQQGDRLREQKRDAEQQQKAQAQQQADQLERDRKQQAGQREQARERTQQQDRERGQKAAQEQRQRQEQQRTLQERERGQNAAQEQQRAQQEQQRAQQAAQKAQQEQQRAQQEQRRAQQDAEQAQKAQQEAQRVRDRERADKAAQDQLRAQQQQQRAQQEQQRAQQEQQRAQQAALKAQQEQQRAQQEQLRAQQAAAQKAQQEQQRAQQEQQRAQQAAQKAQQEQQQRAQRPEAAQAAPKPEAQEAEKGKRERARKDPADKD